MMRWNPPLGPLVPRGPTDSGQALAIAGLLIRLAVGRGDQDSRQADPADAAGAHQHGG